MTNRILVFFFISFVSIIFSSCNYCPSYEQESTPSPTIFFLKKEHSLYLVKVEYFAVNGGLFNHDECYSKVHIFKMESSGFQKLKDLKIDGKCELNKYYFFNKIYPLAFPSDEYIVTWWKGCSINEPVEYSVYSIDKKIISRRSLSNGLFVMSNYVFRYGGDIFFFYSNEGEWNWVTHCGGSKYCWNFEPVSRDVKFDCELPEAIEKAEVYMDPVSNVPYYLAFVTDGVDIFKFSIEETNEKNYSCSFVKIGGIKGKFKKAFFAFPFFAGETSSSSDSVNFQLVNMENQEKIFYSFSFTSNTGELKEEKILTLSGLFKFDNGILFTFSRMDNREFYRSRYDVYLPYDSDNNPDYFASAWYFENFEKSEPLKLITLKFPMGWFSLINSFGGMTQYNNYIFSLGKDNVTTLPEDLGEIINGGCKSSSKPTYSIFRGKADESGFIWKKIGSVKFDCRIEW